jgi:hypothetical protein
MYASNMPKNICMHTLDGNIYARTETWSPYVYIKHQEREKSFGTYHAHFHLRVYWHMKPLMRTTAEEKPCSVPPVYEHIKSIGT